MQSQPRLFFHAGRVELQQAMHPDEFDRLVEAAYRRIPGRFRRRLKNIAVVVEREPTPAQLAQAGVSRGGTLLGLYEGRPLTARSVFESFTMPDRITVFQGPHERLARSPEHLKRLIEETVWHEVAHYFGMDERRVRAAERKRHAGNASTSSRARRRKNSPEDAAG